MGTNELHPHFVVVISNACETSFFAEDARSPRNWKVVLHWKPRGQRYEFNQDVNLEIAMFDLGNNANHACLRMIIPVEQTMPPSKCQWTG
jgi:hypothetical protein